MLKYHGGMLLLSVESVSKQYSEQPLLADITFGINAGDRIGMIGINGSGKSTLLKIVAGVEQPDAGRIVTRGGARVAYLPQNPIMPAALTVLEYLFAGDDPRMGLLREYEQVVEHLRNTPTDGGLLRKLGELQERIEVAGAWEVERQARELLTRLGIDDTSRQLGLLSGGQRRRVAMAGALMQNTDLLILDEPTNHIDADTIAWLETLLARSPTAVLLVTHDRYFLDRLVTRTIEIDHAKIYEYAGGYSRYLAAKAERAEAQRAGAERYASIMRKELAWLAQGAQARTTKQKARIDRIGRMQENMPAEESAGLAFTVQSPQRLGKRVLELEKVGKRFGAHIILDNFTRTIGPGDRVGIVGPNGSGKSTLLNLIAERLAPDRGTIVRGETVRLAYYDQESSDLEPETRVIDYLTEAATLIQGNDGAVVTAATMLERFLFSQSAQYARIGSLSGGERRRLYLLRTLVFGPNVLLLDEPTNDLDIQTLTILEDYLDGYTGTLLVASHDRYFLDRTVDQILGFEGEGRVSEYAGGYTAYAAERSRRQATRTTEQRPTRTPAAPQRPTTERPRTLTHKEKREITALEEHIAALEQEQKQNEATLAGASVDYEALNRASERLAQITMELETAVERWAELSVVGGQ